MFLYDFHEEFYDKDIEMTQYMCSLRSLSLLIDGAKRELYKLHNEISLAELNEPMDQDNLLYSSVLCKVYKGKWNGKVVAVKVFDPNGMGFTREGFLQEISLLSLIVHPNAGPFYGACSENQETPFIVMKYFPKGSLKNLIEKSQIDAVIEKEKEEANIKGIPWYNHRASIDTSLIVNMCMKAANGIHYLHTKCIIHCDIKATNFLVDEHYNVYVIDYGVSHVSPDDPQ